MKTMEQVTVVLECKEQKTLNISINLSGFLCILFLFFFSVLKSTQKNTLYLILLYIEENSLSCSDSKAHLKFCRISYYCKFAHKQTLLNIIIKIRKQLKLYMPVK